VKTTKELVAHALANPGKLNAGNGGTGSFSHLITALFDLLAGTRMTHVPYKGTGPALNDVVGGQLQVFIGSTPSTAPHVRSGRLRALGITSKVPSSALPEVPPIADAVPGYYAPLIYGIFGPRGLPSDVRSLWNREVAKLLQTPDMKQRLTLAGIDPVGGPPEHFRTELKADLDRWVKVVKATGIKAID
jgi:tripartite-type tricarboxylate transporter receptor subunit TctC